MQRLAESLSGIDWTDCAQIFSAGERVRRQLLDDGGALLLSLVERLETNPALQAKCEAFEIFSKLVLHQEGLVKLRMHFFETPVWEAHNHRAPFYCYMLSGTYVHTTYGFCDPGDAAGHGRLRAGHCYEQRAGMAYAITHDYVHSTIASEPSVSLFVQGPALQESLTVASLNSGTVRVRHGSSMGDQTQEPGERKLQATEIGGLVARARTAIRDHIAKIGQHG